MSTPQSPATPPDRPPAPGPSLDERRRFGRSMMRTFALLFVAFAGVVAILRVFDLPRSTPVLMGVWFAATTFFMPEYPGSPRKRSLVSRLLVAAAFGVVGALLLRTVE